ncbi:hypothetical protein KC865_02650 [Candidatus Kaiserbacteria bacterium]|nr:hypothetical protein [Candidatus Kaiserbacteria bacterium]USN91849.1 MAG: hypothetical protein H6782_03165 [Candidatus Nomurabacteria bacterium]
MTILVTVKKVVGACLVLILFTPLFGEVFAQQPEEEGDLSDINATSSEVDAESGAPLAPALDDESWFKTETIFGDKIDVGDFVVGPGKAEIDLNPGETVIQEITVTNRISDDRVFKLELEDITGSEDGSSAVSLTGKEDGPYSIKDYISYPKDTFTLKLGERARIPITITVPPNAEPGGYYGSVLVSTVRDPGNRGELAPSSPIIARVGSLFFLTVRGDSVIEGKTLSVKTINTEKWYEKGPIELGILYENTGSVHVNPYGEISITNMFGEEVGFVEIEPWFVLPTSLRIREITWDREFLLGRYTVKASINRGYDDIVDVAHTSFWVLPWKVVGGMFLILFIVIFSLRAFFRTFELKRKN